MYTIMRGDEEDVQREWVALCTDAEVRPGQSRLFEVHGMAILLCHTSSGFAAVENLCTHKALPLDRGRLIGNELICPHHGARFCLADGRALAGAIRPLRTLKVAIVEGVVQILMAV